MWSRVACWWACWCCGWCWWCCWWCGAVTAEDFTLHFVQALWRHGDRAPAGPPYPKDRYAEDYWPRGWNQLTNDGIHQLRDLGKVMNDMYVGSFLKKNFNAKDVYIRSSDKDRALVSAQSFLSTMFPPAADDVVMAGVLWNPIAVHATDPGVEDPLLKPLKFKCPNYNRIYRPLLRSFEHTTQDDYKDFFDFLAEKTGLDDFELSDLKSLEEINKEVRHKLRQPEWVDKRWLKHGNKTTLELITEISTEMRTLRFRDPTLAKLKVGFLLGDFVKHARNVDRRTQHKPRKMLLYSSHDATLQALMHAFGFSDVSPVPYGGCLIMEVGTIRDVTHLRFFFYGDSKLRSLRLRGCEEDCSLDMALQILNGRYMETKAELYEQCGRYYCMMDGDLEEQTERRRRKRRRHRKGKKRMQKSRKHN